MNIPPSLPNQIAHLISAYVIPSCVKSGRFGAQTRSGNYLGFGESCNYNEAIAIWPSQSLDKREPDRQNQG